MSLIVRSLALAVAALLPVACLSEDPRPAIDGPPRDTAADPDAGTEPSADGPAPEGPPVAVEAGATGETGSPEATTPAPDAGPSGDDGGVEPDVSPDLRPDVTPIGPLLAHWPLDEGMGTTVADVSPNGNGGMVVGGAAWTPSGWPGAMFPNPGALVFDGVDDFVELGLRTIPPVEVPKTISTWFWLEIGRVHV